MRTRCQDNGRFNLLHSGPLYHVHTQPNNPDVVRSKIVNISTYIGKQNTAAKIDKGKGTYHGQDDIELSILQDMSKLSKNK